MTIWIVYTGEYSDKCVEGVYSSLELATAAAELYRDGYVSQGLELDEHEQHIRAGLGRWQVLLERETGHVFEDGHGARQPRGLGPGTGERATLFGEVLRKYHGGIYSDITTPILIIECDAMSVTHAIKIAGDERRGYLASQS